MTKRTTVDKSTSIVVVKDDSCSHTLVEAARGVNVPVVKEGWIDDCAAQKRKLVRTCSTLHSCRRRCHQPLCVVAVGAAGVVVPCEPHRADASGRRVASEDQEVCVRLPVRLRLTACRWVVDPCRGSWRSTMKVQVRGLAAVDPQSGITDGEVYVATAPHGGKKQVYSATLTLTDLSSNVNSYYKLQVIVTGSRFHVFRAWGRTGTSIGGHKVETLGKSDAIVRRCSLLTLAAVVQ